MCLLATARLAAAGCDDTPENNFALRDARTAIDAACPCAAATSPGAHAKCAKVVVTARVESAQLLKSCKSAALNHAKKSICGRPGAVVCCRTKPGKTSHKIAKSAGKCTSTPALTACTSLLEFIDTGCDADGCVAPFCGNDVVEPTETCEPSFGVDCSDSCQIETCAAPATSCGNGTVDAGETCEPPGSATCGWDCLATPCAAAAPGEIDVACVGGAATVGVGSRGTDYLMSWTGNVHRASTDVIGRRFDVNGAPLEASARLVSAGVHCTGAMQRPAVAGTAGRYVLTWDAYMPEVSPAFYSSIYTRAYANDGSLGTLDEAALAVGGFGMCHSFVEGPTAIAAMPAAGPDTLSAFWGFRPCGFVRGAEGTLLDYATDPATRTTVTFTGPPAPLPPPAIQTGSSIAAASTATDTLVTLNRATWNGGPLTNVSDAFVIGAWLANDGTGTNLFISSRAPGGTDVSPTVAAASDRFLVAWAQGAATDPTAIRAMRVTRAGGPLDPDGGIALPTAGGIIKGGPVAAFDGTLWLVVWSEVGGGGNDLRAVAVQTDGTVVDATPRLLATGLGDAAPSIASAGDGRSLLMYVKADGGSSAIRAQLVPGM